MIGGEGFRGANQNIESLHDSQWEGCILLLTNEKAKTVPKGAGGCLLMAKFKMVEQNRAGACI